MISATTFGQFSRINTVPQIWNNTPPSTSGGVLPLVLNNTTNQMQAASTETDSARNYTPIGQPVCFIKWATSDTVTLNPANYAPGQIFSFIMKASGAHTTHFVTTGNRLYGGTTIAVNDSAFGSTFIYDGSNFWISK